jgi:hypothetical protein
MKDTKSLFEYAGLPKPKEKEGFGMDYRKEDPRWRLEEKSKSKITNGCYSKDLED